MPTKPPTPPPLPRSTTDILVFGGSFDPPHVGHTRTALQALHHVLPGTRSALLLVPNARSPHKSRSPVAADEHRLAMLRLALAGHPQAAVWTDELDRAAASRNRRPTPPRPSFTIDTLKRLRRTLGPKPRLHLLLGYDQALAFHRWHQPRAILKLATPVVMPRPLANADQPRSLNGVLDFYLALRDTRFWTPAELAAWCARLAPIDPIECSSSQIRAALPNAGPLDHPPLGRTADSAPWSLLHPDVARYISAHGLYRVAPAL